MRVVSEGLDDVGAGSQEIAMEGLDLLGEIENDFGDVGSRLQVAPALQFKQIALGANHRAGGELIEQTRLHHCPTLLRRVVHDRRPRGAIGDIGSPADPKSLAAQAFCQVTPKIKKRRLRSLKWSDRLADEGRASFPIRCAGQWPRLADEGRSDEARTRCAAARVSECLGAAGRAEARTSWRLDGGRNGRLMLIFRSSDPGEFPLST